MTVSFSGTTDKDGADMVAVVTWRTVHANDWRNISITLIIGEKGEGKAHTC